MADNVTVDTITGSPVIATDDDGVAQHQYVKVEFGADNTQTKVTSSVGLPTNVVQVGGTAIDSNSGNKSAGTVRVVLATDQPALTTAFPTLVKSGTATRTAVADSAVSGTILASNANRLGAVITNDSSAVLYLAYGAGPATSTDYSVQVSPSGDTIVVPANYTGIITGIWASDPGDGGARVTEFT